MKLTKVIQKNIMLLFRSKASLLILIFAPLLVIMLVGVSFSTNTYSLKIGTYSDKYSNLSDSLVEKLQAEKYSIEKFPAQDACIDSVKQSATHACIIFPPDMVIDNQKSNVIKFYVDQSKINLVYLVMSTLTSAFGQKSSEISKGLTDTIVTTLMNVKTGIQDAIPILADVKTKNSNLGQDADSSISSLGNLDLKSEKATSIQTSLGDLKTEIVGLIEDSADLVTSGIDMTNNLDSYKDEVNDSSGFQDDMDDIIGEFEALNETLTDGQNVSVRKIDQLVIDINNTLGRISSKLETAKNVNSQVLSKLRTVKTASDDLKTKSEQLDTKMNELMSNINSVQVTNTESIVSPISTEINPVAKSESNLSFLFPSLIVMFIMFLGLILPATIIIMEKNSRASFRIFTTPTKNRLYVIASYLTSMILIFFQLFIILLVSQFYFKINFLSSFFMLAVTLGIIATFFILLGMLIGYLLNSEEMAMLTSVSIGTLFLLTSGLIFPIESMPSYILDKAKFNPVVLGSELFKKTLLFGADFNAIKGQMASLLALSIVVVFLILFIKKSDKIMILLRKPNRLRIRKEYLISLFDFGERKAKTLPEFVISIQNLNDDKFIAYMKQSIIGDWLLMVYKNSNLSKKIEGTKTRDELVKILVEEVKKTSEQKSFQKPKLFHK